MCGTVGRLVQSGGGQHVADEPAVGRELRIADALSSTTSTSVIGRPVCACPGAPGKEPGCEQQSRPLLRAGGGGRA